MPAKTPRRRAGTSASFAIASVIASVIVVGAAVFAPHAALAQGAPAAGPPAPAPPPERKLMRYVVVKGDSCQGLAQRIYGDARRIDLLHQFNDLGPTPHVLKEGLVLFFPPPDQAPPLSGPDAKLAFVRNRVTVENPATKLGQVNDPLSRGNKVSTDEGASAEIVFRDETRIQLGEKTLVVVFGDSSKKASQKSIAADTELVSGELRAHLGALAGDTPIAVKTTHGEAQLGPGEAQVQADAQGTRLSVFTGSSKLAGKSGSVTLSAGFGSRALADGTVSAPHALPAAPVWTVTPPPSFLSSGRLAELSATFAPGKTDKGKAPARWHVQVARDPGFNDLLLDQREPLTTTTLALKRLGAAHYYARVSAIDDEGFEGPYAATIRMTAMLARLIRNAEGKATTAQITPGNVYCALDNGRLAPLSTALKKSRGAFRKLRCGPSADARLASEIDIPTPIQLPYKIAATLASPDGDARRALLVVNVADAAGQPVAASRLALTLPSTIGAGSMEEELADGEYRGAIWWDEGTKELALRLSVDGSEELSVATLALPGATVAPVVEAPPAEAPPPVVRPAGCSCETVGARGAAEGGAGGPGGLVGLVGLGLAVGGALVGRRGRRFRG